MKHGLLSDRSYLLKHELQFIDGLGGWATTDQKHKGLQDTGRGLLENYRHALALRVRGFGRDGSALSWGDRVALEGAIDKALAKEALK
jgi:hypothetical protein